MGSSRRVRVNDIGLAKTDYNGAPTTLCQGCGHNSISSQIISVAYELSLAPHEVIKLSGIGCSSKSPTYFLGQSHGFNALHGRMPSVGTGAVMMNHNLRALGVSGDGDTASIGMGQFKHALRRNVRMVYIVENNGVYGLTKGQFSATATEGYASKYAGGVNKYPEEDLCLEAIVAGCGFVARSFSGDPKQVRELLKAALAYEGTAFLDIISPCVAFNNRPDSPKSYDYGRANEEPLHDVSWVPVRDEITIDDYDPGTTTLVEMHDGSYIQLRKLDSDYDPTDRMGAMHRLMWAKEHNEFITGLVYYDGSREKLADVVELGEQPIAEMDEAQLRPSPDKFNALMDKFRL